MAHTKNNRLIGAAAAAQNAEFRALLIEEGAREYKRRRDAERAETADVCGQIASLITPAQYAAWWKAAPEDNDGFLSAARELLAELHRAETAECEEIQAWLSDTVELDGTEPSPVICGGDVYYPTSVSTSVIEPDDSTPF